MVGKELLAKLKKMRRGIPKFRRQEGHRRPMIARTGWRRPKGFHSKLRIQHKSKGARVKAGYRLPREVRGLTVTGKMLVRVETVEALKLLDKAKHIVIISHTVGMRKKLELLKVAKELGLEVENIDVAKYEAKAKELLAERKVSRKVKKAKKEKKKAKKEDAKKEEKKEDKKEEPAKEEKKEAKPKKKKGEQ